MSHSHNDFIEVYDNALSREQCAALIQRFERSNQLQPGAVGGGVYPELKHSSDLTISGRPEWQDAEQALNTAMLNGLVAYLRRYPHTLIAPLMLQMQDPNSGEVRRLDASDVERMNADRLVPVLQQVFRPGAINLQRYRAGEGGYPYWHCELYPRDRDAECLHRTLLWTVYLNDGFDEGETEFLYQERKVKPKVGSLLIAPAAFTHTHRGNRPQRGDKYIATSWVLFRRAEQLYPDMAAA
ncbi:2OG-Fe(II) oxygenase [Aquimonas voraii]|uniref:Prolyl 4-hydroxylase alpha subunit Fe(2+) 2OG dioxygenase domain-containing protein n=1 Tax=Aquimonas voraii TaxID=265719 RepID=A0A1G6X4P8_9GAMM|nr:2OG-Fe(II) oxygenase [Aquimonas voraii]SDD73071.1 hypothetical protein SAMN04488509_10636 [Aquimonas voraii]